jgi:hypothetical protein
MIMKKVTFFFSTLMAALMIFSACEVEDLDNPTITLVGGDMEIVLNDPAGFTEPGFAATDEQDGDLTAQVIVTGTVDVTKIGSYEITYSVSDKAGNKTTAKRIVDVIVKQSTYLGVWSVSEVITGSNPDPNWMYSATIAASSNQTTLLITNFGGMTSNFIANVTFDKFGKFTIPNQQLIGAGEDGTIEGEGISETSPNGNTLTIKYKVNWVSSGTDHSVGTWTRSK